MDDEEAPLALALDDTSETARPGDGGQPEGTTVPVTIVTGFLGAGKTTLVRHILTGDHGYRIAVILNEFGEDVGIESSFVRSDEGLQHQDGQWVELTNGCMCCAVKSDFLQALESLLDRPPAAAAASAANASGGGPSGSGAPVASSSPSSSPPPLRRRRFDYILIETSGLANPGPIATALWTDAELESRVRLDGVVTVVDAVNINRQLHEPRPRGAVNEAQVQVAYADIVVLNKLDLVEDEALTRAEADIRAINSGVTIVRTQKSTVDLGLILNRNGYSHKGDLVLPPIAEADDEVETGDRDIPEAARAQGGATTPERSSHAGEVPARRRSTGVSCCSSRAHSFHSRSGTANAIAAAAAAAVAACGGGGGGGGGGASSSAPGSTDLSPSGSMVLQSSLLAAAATAAAAATTPTRGPSRAASDGGGADHVHDHQVSTISLRCDHPVDLERFKSWVDHLLWDRDSRLDEIYRMKGLLWVARTNKKHMLQAVYELYEVVSGPEWQPGEVRATRLVIIGRNLRPTTVRASWAEFVGDAQQQEEGQEHQERQLQALQEEGQGQQQQQEGLVEM